MSSNITMIDIRLEDVFCDCMARCKADLDGLREHSK